MKLYHFTCRHAARKVKRTRTLVPYMQPMLGNLSLVWLTDLDDPTREQVGLTSHTLRCDRLEVRFLTAPVDVYRWTDFARSLPTGQRRSLELTPDALPAHWWVSTADVPVVETLEGF